MNSTGIHQIQILIPSASSVKSLALKFHWISSNPNFGSLSIQCEIPGCPVRMPSSEISFQKSQSVACKVIRSVVGLLVHGVLKGRRTFGHFDCV